MSDLDDLLGKDLLGQNLLGKNTSYQFNYDASVLYPIPRCEGRQLLGIGEKLPFTGVDQWTAYEFSWLNTDGLPQVAIVEFIFPCTALNLIESKSFKLYLNTFNQTIFSNRDKVQQTLFADLSKVCGAPVEITLFEPNTYPIATSVVKQNEFILIDQQLITCTHYLPEASLLFLLPSKKPSKKPSRKPSKNSNKESNTKANEEKIEKKLYSQLFRSLCPVTGQPDWASIYIHYKGQEIAEQSLLQYLVSFRNHQGFHEQCVEQIFTDIMQQCMPDELMVYARFLRRGGLDINPLRSTSPCMMPTFRDPRQ